MSAWLSNRLRFDRSEFAGAFGDLGTSLPLIMAMILASEAHTASVLILFGVMQVFSALIYGVPVPAQPLKAVAALTIAFGYKANLIYGAGLSIGIVMLIMTFTGIIDWFGKVIPKVVVRGIQLGVGLKLATLAMGYIGKDGSVGYVLAAICFAIVLLLLKNRTMPPALIIVALGICYAFIMKKQTLMQ